MHKLTANFKLTNHEKSLLEFFSLFFSHPKKVII
jgi:hypothetical protein